MRCSMCGRESSESAIFCESCGSRLGMPHYGTMYSPPVTVEPVRKDIKTPLAVVIFGVVIVVIGVLFYAWAISNVVHNVGNTDPNDPFGTADQMMGDVSLVFASYAVMAIGGIVFIVGLIFLILKMA